MKKTLVDFWHLVWQERSQVIVMVTNLKENQRINVSNIGPNLQWTLQNCTFHCYNAGRFDYMKPQCKHINMRTIVKYISNHLL